MSEAKDYCPYCNSRVTEKPKTMNWYRDEISKLLKLKPTGKTNTGEPYWSTWEKRWLMEVYEAINRELPLA